MTRHTSRPSQQASQRGRSSFAGKGDTPAARRKSGRATDTPGAARSARGDGASGRGGRSGGTRTGRSSVNRGDTGVRAGRADARREDARAGRASRQTGGRGAGTAGIAATLGRALVAAGRGLVAFVIACIEALGALVGCACDLVARQRGTLRRRPRRLEVRQVVTLVALAVVIAVPTGIVGSCNARHAEEQRAAAQAAQSRQDAQELASLIPSAARCVAQASIEPTSTPRDQWQKGTMPYLYQIDPQYRDEQYSNGSMRLQGCGPFALDMVYIHLTGDTSVGPVEMAAYATKNGYSTDRNGSAWALIGDGAAGLGLKSKSIATSASALKAALEAGNDVICIMGPGTFTRVGHFIAIEGLDADGKAIVHDSNSYGRSHMTWDLDLIASEARNAWSLSA